MSTLKQMKADEVNPTVAIYDRPNTTTMADDTYEEPVAVERPRDLVRWGPVLAGLFAALATLATLTVLGLAIGLSSYTVGDQASTFGIGAGIWGAVSALIAFGVGGWLAARTAATRGNTSGILNGAMVWFVTIPLLVYLLGSGIGALARTAGGVAGTAASVVAPIAGQAAGAAANDPALQATAATGAQGAGQAVQATAQALADEVTPERVETAANTAGSAAWGTLLSLGLAAAAAITGGYLGGRRHEATVTRAAA